jgi:legumain
VLTALQLYTTLERMYRSQKYDRVTFYMDSCLSGSMFDGILEDLNVYAVTSSNSTEDSYMKFCPEECEYNNGSLPCQLGTCLGAMFSDEWMKDAEKHISNETLDEDFHWSKRKVKHYMQKNRQAYQTVSLFGDMHMKNERLSDFFGDGGYAQKIETYKPLGVWRKTEARLKMLQHRWNELIIMNRSWSEVEESARLDAFNLIIKQHRHVDVFLAEIARHVLVSNNKQRAALTTPPQRITKLHCHHEVVHAFKRHCSWLMPKIAYALKFASLMTNFCEMGLPAEYTILRLQEFC